MDAICANALIAGARSYALRYQAPGRGASQTAVNLLSVYPPDWPPLDTPCPPEPAPLQVTPWSARWHAAEKDREYREGYWHWLLRACVPAPDEELFALYGPDATIAIAQIGEWAMMRQTPYAQNYFCQRDGRIGEWLKMRLLDIHTLPPVGPACYRLELSEMPTLKRFADKSLPQLIGFNLSGCPALEEFPELPQFHSEHDGGGGYRTVDFKMELGKGVLGLLEKLTINVGHPAHITDNKSFEQHLRVWRRCLWWRENKDQLWAEAGKPWRVDAYLRRLGWEGMEDKVCEGVGSGPAETVVAPCKMAGRSWLDMYTPGTRQGVCSYAGRFSDEMTVDHHGPVWKIKCSFCGEPWFARSCMGYNLLRH